MRLTARVKRVYHGYLKRIITFSSHRTLSNEEISNPTDPEKQTLKLLFNNLIDNYSYFKNKTNKDNDTTN